jgi:hypothetical protein
MGIIIPIIKEMLQMSNVWEALLTLQREQHRQEDALWKALTELSKRIDKLEYPPLPEPPDHQGDAPDV